MLDKSKIDKLSERLRLSPYQANILENNSLRYDWARLVKRGGILYAPYIHNDRGGREIILRMLFGRRADLIGMNRILIQDQRGIKLHAMGFYSARKRGIKYYADAAGNRISRQRFFSII